MCPTPLFPACLAWVKVGVHEGSGRGGGRSTEGRPKNQVSFGLALCGPGWLP